jgi:hypothetical protein
MEGVEEVRQRQARLGPRPSEAAERGGDAAHRPVRYILHRAALALAKVKLVEMNSLQVLTVIAEGMEVAFADPAPVHEFNAELERPLSCAHELVLIDPEHAVESDERRDGRFAHADRTDLLRLDERDPGVAVVEEARESGRSHPAGGAAADDDEVADRVFVHRAACLIRWPK